MAQDFVERLNPLQKDILKDRDPLNPKNSARILHKEGFHLIVGSKADDRIVKKILEYA